MMRRSLPIKMSCSKICVAVAYVWSCVMPSLVPEPRRGADLHFVLCDFGKLGQAYMETDPHEADRDAIVSGLVSGQCPQP
jgi:hypothetical protein